MASAFGSVHVPAGCTVKVGDTIGGLATVGVLKGDSNINVTYDLIKVRGSKAETLLDFIKNMEAEATFELYQLYLPNIVKFLDGAATVTSVAGVIVNDYAQTTVADEFDFNEFIVGDQQNGDGGRLMIDATDEPTCSGATDGALVFDTDFSAVVNAEGKWGIIILDTATVTTMDQVFTITYDYTPSASKTLKMGAASAEMTAKIVEFELTNSGAVWRARLFSVTNDTGMVIGFPDSDTDDLATMPITLKGGLDTTKATGEQLIEIYDEIGLTV